MKLEELTNKEVKELLIEISKLVKTIKYEVKKRQNKLKNQKSD